MSQLTVLSSLIANAGLDNSQQILKTASKSQIIDALLQGGL